MKITIFIGAIALLGLTSCSKDEQNCECNQYIQSSNGSLVLYAGASMQFCDGTLPNPSPRTTVYRKECK
jgi:hypothetical protein